MSANLISYFSAYGHTRIAAEAIGALLKEQGFSYDIRKLPDPSLEIADEYKHLFILTPLYHKNVPNIWDEVLTILPETRNTAVFLCILQGKDRSSFCSASVFFKSILHKKGYKVIDELSLPSPEMTDKEEIHKFTTPKQVFSPPDKDPF